METMKENYDTLFYQIKLHHQTELEKLQPPQTSPVVATDSPESTETMVALKVVQNLIQTDQTIRLSAMFKCDIEKGANLCISGGNVSGKYYILHSDYKILPGCKAAIVFQKCSVRRNGGMDMYALLDVKE